MNKGNDKNKEMAKSYKITGNWSFLISNLKITIVLYVRKMKDILEE